MDAKSIERWLRVFSDYEIVQPFAQLTRTVRALPEDKKSAQELEVDVPSTSSEAFFEKLRSYALYRRRSMYRAPGFVYLASTGATITKVKISFGRRRIRYPLERVPALDISEALHDVLD
jgi:hypothetical protein